MSEPGDEVMFYGTKYTLLERSGNFGWLAIETDNANAKPRIILSEYLKPLPPAARGGGGGNA